MTAPLAPEAAPTLAEITVTFCDACDNCHPATRKLHPRQWLCQAHPKLPRFHKFTTDKPWDGEEPFLRCIDVNGGMCRTFEPRRGNDG